MIPQRFIHICMLGVRISIIVDGLVYSARLTISLRFEERYVCTADNRLCLSPSWIRTTDCVDLYKLFFNTWVHNGG